jgi:hypothetical protein
LSFFDDLQSNLALFLTSLSMPSSLTRASV